MGLMTSETFYAPSSSTPGGLVTEVDQRVLTARQIRLYIEMSVDFLLGASTAVVLACARLWLFVPDQHGTLIAWAGSVFVTILARFSAWIAFARARPDDIAVPPWLKWCLVPQLVAMAILGSSSFLLLPTSSGNDTEVCLALFAYMSTASLAVSFQLSAYRPLIAPVLATMILTFAVGLLLHQPGTLANVLVVALIFLGVLGYRLATRVNQAFVRSMELSIGNERLATALEARTSQLQQQTLAAEQARQVAERAERDKTRFLAAASHDLRQPMHAISLLVGMLRARPSSGNREVVERLERSVDSMDKLFSTILDLSTLDAGVVKPLIADVPLRAILDSIDVHFAPQATSRQLTLSVFPSRAIVTTDRDLLDRALRNLVSNAIKYSREGGVLVGCRRRGDRLLVGVWDTGVGIAREDLGRIFEEYFQAGKSPRDRSQGLGLGLSIVQRLARLLGSEAEVVSVPGQGSRFGLEVPLAGYLPVGEERDRDESKSESVLFGKLVLVVDDEADVRFGTEALLRQWGCYSTSASSLEEVVASLEQELRFPDAIVTDYRLGNRQTGIDV